MTAWLVRFWRRRILRREEVRVSVSVRLDAGEAHRAWNAAHKAVLEFVESGRESQDEAP